MPSVDPLPLDLLREGERAMRICSACRYCEGFCAVFPAMERRRSFSPGDLTYLANLCHDCRECYYSCPYAPPHELDLNVPRVLSELRRETYRKFAWPASLFGLLGRTGPSLVLCLLLSPALIFLGAVLLNDPSTLFSAHSVEEGSFYRVIPHEVMVLGFGAVGLFVLVALAAGFHNFWRETAAGAGTWLDPRAIGRALGDSLRLRYLGGGGDGCAYPGESASMTRRWFHHLTFYGFALSFASTTTAAIYHNFLGWKAPYELVSVPVILGTIGGFGLLVGPLGLLALKSARDPAPADALSSRMDVALLVLLFLSSLTGLLLLALRETAAMGVVLTVHLGVVLGFFLAMPYGKFVHGIYRFGALLRYAKEERES
jgi:citrate/tricarballylate utilization protein